MKPYYADDRVTVLHGDALDVLRGLPDASVDAVITDPPYGLEFMGREWDAPWQVSDINADAGMSGTGYTDGGERLPRPSFTGSTNPKCLDCKGTRRGRRDGTAKVPVCLCENGGRFPNVRAVEMRAFQSWCELWTAECLRVLKPGGHLLAFGGTRTWHRLACAVEDAGFEMRPSIAWLYGSGFPKSLDVSKAIDKAAGAEREVVGTTGQRRDLTRNGRTGDEAIRPVYATNVHLDVTAPATPDAERWQGWGTALKPSFEPIVVARKPLQGTVASNVLQHGTGALNIDATRIDGRERTDYGLAKSTRSQGATYGAPTASADFDSSKGRWPTNVVLDDSQAAELDQQSGERTSGARAGGESRDDETDWRFKGGTAKASTGGASRFFPTFRYEAKAPTSERPRVNGTAHPTVKPLDLMRWLVRLVTPPGGTVLEPFAGSGTTVEACIVEGFHCIAIEREADYLPLIMQRVNRRRDPVAYIKASGDELGLFDLEGLT